MDYTADPESLKQGTGVWAMNAHPLDSQENRGADEGKRELWNGEFRLKCGLEVGNVGSS